MTPGSAHATRHSDGVRVRADDEVTRLLEPLRGDHTSVTPDELLARVVWSRLAEPGDVVAGEVIARLGALSALDLLLAGTDAASYARAIRDTDADECPVSSRRIAAAMARWRPRLDRSATIEDLRVAAHNAMTLVTPGDDDWPAALQDLGPHAPHALWVRGTRGLLAAPSLAVVGARDCSGYGAQVTAELTSEACAVGFTIVSGAAYGVDAVAHRTALAADSPTIAVLAGGADRPYPAAHDRLISRIAAQGAVCSELVPGAAPTRWRFLQRNRLIAALARAVLVTEAGIRSGTLNTAGHGAELGRALGAVPGPVTSATSAGCHRLIRDYGATLVTNRADVLELLEVQALAAILSNDPAASEAPGVPGTPGAHETLARKPSLHLRVLDALPLRGSRTLTEAARRAGVAPQEAADALAELELLGHVARRGVSQEGDMRWALLKRI